MQAFDSSIRYRHFRVSDFIGAGAPRHDRALLRGWARSGAHPAGGRTRARAFSIVLLVMACLGILLGGPSVCRAASSIAIGGEEYDEPGASGDGWAWRDASTLVLSGYNGSNISIHGPVTLVLEGANVAAFDPNFESCEFYTGLECFGDLTVRGGGSLTAIGDQAGILVKRGTLSIEGCTIDARARGGALGNAVCAGVLADALEVTGGAKLTAASAADLGRGSYGVCVGVGDTGGTGAAGQAGGATINASTVDATGLTGGFVVARDITLEDVGVTVPQGGTVGAVTVTGATDARGVVDPAGGIAPHAVIAPGEAGGGTGDGDGSGGSGGGTGGDAGGATEPTNPGGGSNGGSGGADTGAPSEKPTAGEPKPTGKTPEPTPAASDTPTKQTPRQTAKLISANAPLPITGEVPLDILLLIPASAAFFAYSYFKAKEPDR